MELLGLPYLVLNICFENPVNEAVISTGYYLDII